MNISPVVGIGILSAMCAINACAGEKQKEMQFEKYPACDTQSHEITVGKDNTTFTIWAPSA
ncbi:MAG: hypothetical protein K2F61_05810, partial [Muribaculaceae bacterium]|nr:hypothetical protein [Muribaculaceae bacterium]